MITLPRAILMTSKPSFIVRGYTRTANQEIVTIRIGPITSTRITDLPAGTTGTTVRFGTLATLSKSSKYGVILAIGRKRRIHFGVKISTPGTK